MNAVTSQAFLPKLTAKGMSAAAARPSRLQRWSRRTISPAAKSENEKGSRNVNWSVTE